MGQTPPPERLEKLNRLDGLSTDELARIVAAGRHVHLPANWALIWEKTPADKVYLIIEGEVSVRKRGQEVARLGPGDVIGEMAIVEHKLRNASVVSLTELEVLHFTSEAVRQLLDEIPALATALRETTNDRLGAPAAGD
jgi:CRP/FNR family transcriptional regulator, cyclic AMP receptor protein